MEVVSQGEDRESSWRTWGRQKGGGDECEEDRETLAVPAASRPSAERRTGTDVSQGSNVDLQRQNRRGKIRPGWSEHGGIQKKTSACVSEETCPDQRQMSTS